MLSTQQQKVVDIHNITARQCKGGYVFLIAGRELRQSPAMTYEGAIKKAIGYIMSNYKK
jgi:hypothetical protein